MSNTTSIARLLNKRFEKRAEKAKAQLDTALAAFQGVAETLVPFNTPAQKRAGSELLRKFKEVLLGKEPKKVTPGEAAPF